MMRMMGGGICTRRKAGENFVVTYRRGESMESWRVIVMGFYCISRMLISAFTLRVAVVVKG